MAPKRPAAAVHPSRSAQVPAEPSRKKRKINPYASTKPGQTRPSSKSFKKAHPTNELKSRIRSLSRLLEHDQGLPATIRVEKERELQTTERELQQAIQAQKRSDIISRWHKVRFFDRQKATKRVKKAQKAVNAMTIEDGDAITDMMNTVQEWETAVNYAMYYPLDVAYVPLFPSRHNKDKETDVEDSGAAEVERQGDPEMWENIKQCMRSGTLQALQELRDGRLPSQDVDGDKEVTRKSGPQHKTKTQEKKKSADATTGGKRGIPEEASDGDSDGGFFTKDGL